MPGDILLRLPVGCLWIRLIGAQVVRLSGVGAGRIELHRRSSELVGIVTAIHCTVFRTGPQSGDDDLVIQQVTGRIVGGQMFAIVDRRPLRGRLMLRLGVQRLRGQIGVV